MPVYFNPGNGPVVYDTAGRAVGGKEWVDTEDTERVLKLVASGDLILVKTPEPAVVDDNQPALEELILLPEVTAEPEEVVEPEPEPKSNKKSRKKTQAGDSV